MDELKDTLQRGFQAAVPPALRPSPTGQVAAIPNLIIERQNSIQNSFDEMERLILVNSILDSKGGADKDELRQENMENIERHMRNIQTGVHLPGMKEARELYDTIDGTNLFRTALYSKFQPFCDDFNHSCVPLNLAELFKSACFKHIHGEYNAATFIIQTILQHGSLWNRGRLAAYSEGAGVYFDQGYFNKANDLLTKGLEETRTMVLCEETIYQALCLKLELEHILLKISKLPRLNLALQHSFAWDMIKSLHEGPYSPIKLKLLSAYHKIEAFLSKENYEISETRQVRHENNIRPLLGALIHQGYFHAFLLMLEALRNYGAAYSEEIPLERILKDPGTGSSKMLRTLVQEATAPQGTIPERINQWWCVKMLIHEHGAADMALETLSGKHYSRSKLFDYNLASQLKKLLPDYQKCDSPRGQYRVLRIYWKQIQYANEKGGRKLFDVGSQLLEVYQTSGLQYRKDEMTCSLLEGVYLKGERFGEVIRASREFIDKFWPFKDGRERKHPKIIIRYFEMLEHAYSRLRQVEEMQRCWENLSILYEEERNEEEISNVALRRFSYEVLGRTQDDILAFRDLKDISDRDISEDLSKRMNDSTERDRDHGNIVNFMKKLFLMAKVSGFGQEYAQMLELVDRFAQNYLGLDGTEEASELGNLRLAIPLKEYPYCRMQINKVKAEIYEARAIVLLLRKCVGKIAEQHEKGENEEETWEYFIDKALAELSKLHGFFQYAMVMYPGVKTVHTIFLGCSMELYSAYLEQWAYSMSSERPLSRLENAVKHVYSSRFFTKMATEHIGATDSVEILAEIETMAAELNLDLYTAKSDHTADQKAQFLADAVTAAENARRILEDQRSELSSLPGESFGVLVAKRSVVGADIYQRTYSVALRACIEQYLRNPSPVSAFQFWDWIQRHKAASLRDLLSRFGTQSNVLWTKIKEDEALMHLVKEEDNLIAAVNASVFEPEPLRARMDALQNLGQHREEMHKYPSLKAMMDIRDGAALDQEIFTELQGFSDTKILIVEYIFVEGQIIMLASGGQLTSPCLHIVKDLTPQLVRDWTKTKLAAEIYKPLDFWIMSVKELEPLVSPILNWARPLELVILLPTDVLHEFPLHALPGYDEDRKEQKILIERNPVVYCPSLGILEECVRRQASVFRTEPCRSAVMSKFDDDSAPQSTDDLEILTQWQQEIDLVKSHTSSLCSLLSSSSTPTTTAAPTTLLQNSFLTPTTFLAAASNADIIHYHGHASFSSSPSTQSLILSPSQTPLSASSLFALNLGSRSSLVTVIACNSGKQDIGAGDEPLGLVSAFLFAGATSVVGTMWAIASEDGRRFSERFYRDLISSSKAKTEEGTRKKGLVNVAEAIRRTVVAMIDGEELESDGLTRDSPYHWAGFFVQGAWQFQLG